MLKRKSISAFTISTFTFAIVCLMASVGIAQTSEVRQDERPKGSRSNIYNNRTATATFDPIVIDLGKESSEK